MALYRSPLTVTLWPSSFLKKYGPMIPPDHKAHQTWLEHRTPDRSPGFDARCHRVHTGTCSSTQGVRSLVGRVTSAGTGEYFPPLQFPCRNCGGGVAIYCPIGEFRRDKSHCHLYGALGQRQAYL
ncbi:hypothetical protein TNCV_2551661 [Trichonephila clavipes]|nr:hypothetical protein TNCV_2551661 [Trichonephila clavipes]